MVEPRLAELLAAAVNTSCKLAITLHFAEQPTLQLTAGEVAMRIYRDIFSVEDALSELVEDGVLTMDDSRYHCADSRDVRAQLRQLREAYADPLQRNELQQLLREIETYAPYRDELPNQFWHSLAA